MYFLLFYLLCYSKYRPDAKHPCLKLTLLVYTNYVGVTKFKITAIKEKKLWDVFYFLGFYFSCIDDYDF